MKLTDIFDQEYVDIMLEALDMLDSSLCCDIDYDSSGESSRKLAKVTQIRESLKQLPVVIDELNNHKLLKIFLNRKMKGLSNE